DDAEHDRALLVRGAGRSFATGRPTAVFVPDDALRLRPGGESVGSREQQADDQAQKRPAGFRSFGLGERRCPQGQSLLSVDGEAQRSGRTRRFAAVAENQRGAGGGRWWALED